jgi:pimeloyl-ACP methyl ester carboxylesterase
MNTVSRHRLRYRLRKILFSVVIAAALITLFGWNPQANAAAPARSIDEGAFVDVNGVQQWVTIRGSNRDNPVLLLLHGGPGIAMSGLAPLFAEWEGHYTIVQWDQPFSGSTAVKNLGIDQGAATIERFVNDGLTVAEFARQHLGASKIVLLGNSWGTLIGLEMIRKRPDLFSAYVGTSQAVSGLRGGRVGYELGLEAARKRNDEQAIAALERVGPPPYRTLEEFLVRQQYTNPPGLPASAAEQAANMAMFKLMSAPPAPDAKYIAYRTLPEGFNGQQNFMDTQRRMFPLVQAWDAYALGLSFSVPMFIFQGENDLNTPASVAREYFDQIQAPRKAFAIIPGAGHNTLAFAGEVLRLLNTHDVSALRSAVRLCHCGGRSDELEIETTL